MQSESLLTLKVFSKKLISMLKKLVILIALISIASCGPPYLVPSISPTGSSAPSNIHMYDRTPTVVQVLNITPSNIAPIKSASPSDLPTQGMVIEYVYGDVFNQRWEENLWDTILTNYTNTNPTAHGKYSMSITPGRGWTAWHAWTDVPFDLSPYEYLTFEARSDTPDTWWEIQFLDQKMNKINQKAFLFSPPTEDWQTYTVNLEEHGVGHKKIHGIRFWYVTNGIETSTLYLDDLGFGGIAPTPQPTPHPKISHYSFAVDANIVVNPFNREMLGVAHGNWEHAWGRYFPGDVPGLAEIYKAANVGLIRYAGGLWANFVMWERSPQKEPYGEYTANPENYHSDFRTKINRTNVYNFHYGMDEIDSLAKLAQAAGAEVLIQVNISKDDPAMWADMVRYVNIEKQYGFQYWELGNEIDLECQQGNTGSCISDETYQNRAERYIQAMKAVDPSITIIGGAAGSGHDIVANNWEDTPDMSRYLVAGVHAGADALSYHWFADCNLKDIKNIFTWKYDAPDTAWQHMYSRYWSALGPIRIQQQLVYPSGRSMDIGITELNIDACDMGRAPANSNHLAALWYADVIGRLAYNGVDFVTWYEGYGNGNQGFPAVATDNDYYPSIDSLSIRPVFYSLFLYGNYFGNVMLKTSDPDPTKISLYASLNKENPQKLYLMVTNLSADVVEADITISGFSPIKGWKYELQNPDPLSLDEASNGINHGSTINGYRLTAQNIVTALNEIPTLPVNLREGDVNETFSPFTVTALVLENGQ